MFNIFSTYISQHAIITACLYSLIPFLMVIYLKVTVKDSGFRVWHAIISAFMVFMVVYSFPVAVVVWTIINTLAICLIIKQNKFFK